MFFPFFVRLLQVLGAFWTDKSLSFRAITMFFLAPGACFLAKTLSLVFGQICEICLGSFLIVFNLWMFCWPLGGKKRHNAPEAAILNSRQGVAFLHSSHDGFSDRSHRGKTNYSCISPITSLLCGCVLVQIIPTSLKHFTFAVHP